MSVYMDLNLKSIDDSFKNILLEVYLLKLLELSDGFDERIKLFFFLEIANLKMKAEFLKDHAEIFSLHFDFISP